MKRHTLLTPAASLLLLGAWACNSEDTNGAAEHEQTWRDNEPEQYVVQTCSLGIEPPGCIREAVDGEQVVEAEERVFEPTAPGWEAQEGSEKLLDLMFERIKAGEVDGCVVDSIEYDEDFGFVNEYTLDCEGSTTGGRQVVCFKPNEQDLSVCHVDPGSGAPEGGM